MHKSVEPLSDHPLFRALVLMGGALSVGCGGVAQREAPGGATQVSDGGSTSAAGGDNSVGGSGIAMGGASVGPATQTGTAGRSDTIDIGHIEVGGGPNAADFYNPTCPYEQWDCAAAPSAISCRLYLTSKDDPLAAGCKCDTSRPTSASACKADEQFVCRQAWPPYSQAAQPTPLTWDGALHVQCACVGLPVITWQNCDAACAEAFGDWKMSQCHLPSASTCEHGVCTATSADVLRQDGIMCGCADIALK